MARLEDNALGRPGFEWCPAIIASDISAARRIDPLRRIARLPPRSVSRFRRRRGTRGVEDAHLTAHPTLKPYSNSCPVIKQYGMSPERPLAITYSVGMSAMTPRSNQGRRLGCILCFHSTRMEFSTSSSDATAQAGFIYVKRLEATSIKSSESSHLPRRDRYSKPPSNRPWNRDQYLLPV